MSQRREGQMTNMTKCERLQAAIRGDTVDRPPVALWRHFPGDDQVPDELAASTIAFQRQYDFDLVKVTPDSSFSVRDWGVEDRWVGNEEGTREPIRLPLQSVEAWIKLRPLDPEQGALGGQLRCLGLLQQAFGEEVPFIQTVFNPLCMAAYLGGQETMMTHLRTEGRALHAALEAITETTVRFIRSARRRGISGIFLAVQHASYRVLSEAEYREFGVPYDRKVLEAAEGLWLNILHLHGDGVMFELLADYPTQVVNWHDRHTPPPLREGQARVQGAVLGGLRQWETMLRGTPEDVRREVRDAIVQTGGRRFILGTGCVTPVTAPWANLRAAREAVRVT
jgi:uroporphyrinogen decarboxylase